MARKHLILNVIFTKYPTIKEKGWIRNSSQPLWCYNRIYMTPCSVQGIRESQWPSGSFLIGPSQLSLPPTPLSLSLCPLVMLIYSCLCPNVQVNLLPSFISCSVYQPVRQTLGLLTLRHHICDRVSLHICDDVLVAWFFSQDPHEVYSRYVVVLLNHRRVFSSLVGYQQSLVTCRRWRLFAVIVSVLYLLSMKIPCHVHFAWQDPCAVKSRYTRELPWPFCLFLIHFQIHYGRKWIVCTMMDSAISLAHHAFSWSVQSLERKYWAVGQ